MFKRGRDGSDRARAVAPAAGRQRSHRVLVIGGRGYNADVCITWDDPVANVTDFDTVVVIPPSDDPGDDVQWRYREAFRDLLLTQGTLYIIGTPKLEWRSSGRMTMLPPDNYDWCPVPIRVDQLRGESIRHIDDSLAWLFRRVRAWSCVVEQPPPGFQPGFSGNEDVAVAYEYEALAQNRAGQALALRTRFMLHRTGNDGYFHRTVEVAPFQTSGWAYVVPVHAPWRAEEVVAETLGAFAGREAGAPAPAWLTDELMPPTPAEDAEIQALDEAQRRIDERMPSVLERRSGLRRIAGMLYETGPALEDLVAEALTELGVGLSEAIGNEEYLALHDGVLAAVEVKGNSKSASGDDYRAAMDHATQLTTDGLRARGILVVCAWRNTPLDSRREWFPNNVEEAARTQGTVALVKSIDLYEAVLAHRQGTNVDGFVKALFTTSGPVPFVDPVTE